MHETQELTERIWKLVQGTTDAELEAHLLTCPECQEERESLQSLYSLRASGGLAPVPNQLSHNLNGLLQKVRPDLVPTSTPGSGVIRHLQTILADLIHDSAIQPQVVGLRGESSTRQIAFVSDVADLDLEVSPEDNRFLIVGQLGMDELPESLSVRFVPSDADPLAEAHEAMHSATISENGYFRLNLDSGEWTVAVDIDDAVVLFPGVKL